MKVLFDGANDSEKYWFEVFAHTESEYGIEASVNGKRVDFLYLPSNPTGRKFIISEFGLQYEKLADLLSDPNLAAFMNELDGNEDHTFSDKEVDLFTSYFTSYLKMTMCGVV
jgi:hypothetical protein